MSTASNPDFSTKLRAYSSYILTDIRENRNSGLGGLALAATGAAAGAGWFTWSVAHLPTEQIVSAITDPWLLPKAAAGVALGVIATAVAPMADAMASEVLFPSSRTRVRLSRGQLLGTCALGALLVAAPSATLALGSLTVAGLIGGGVTGSLTEGAVVLARQAIAHFRPKRPSAPQPGSGKNLSL